DDAVIPVRAAEVVRPVRIHRDQEVRPPAPDLPRDVEARGARVLDLTVLVAEELDPLDAEYARRRPLLVLPDSREPLRRHGAVARSLVAVGHDHVRDLAAFLHQFRDRAGRPEFAVVGMRGDYHGPFELLRHDPLAEW